MRAFGGMARAWIVGTMLGAGAVACRAADEPAAGAVAPGAATGGDPATTPVTMVLQWQHQAQFAGYYMGLAKGLYAAKGLEVRLLRGGPDVSGPELLRAGKADFASLMLPTAIEERARGLPLVHLAQVVNRDNFLLIAWRKPATGGPIETLADLEGRRVTVWERDFRAPYMAMFAARGVRPQVLPQYNTFSLFLHRGADAFAGMRYNEYHGLLLCGVEEDEIRVFSLANQGVDLPEDGIYCLAETRQRRPEICRAFAEATMEGWRYARDHAEETLDAVMDYVDRERLPTNRAHMRWMLKETIASVFPGPDDRWTEGRLSRESYRQAVEVLTRHAGLTNAPAMEDFAIQETAHESR